MQDKGQPQIAEHADAAIVGVGRGDDDRIDALAGGGTAVGGDLFLLRRHGRYQHVDLVMEEALGHSSQELDGVRAIGAAVQHPAEGAGAAGGEPAGAGIRAVAEASRRVGDAPARGLVDLGVAVEGAADRGLREAQIARQLLEIHTQSCSRTRRVRLLSAPLYAMHEQLPSSASKAISNISTRGCMS